MSVIATGSLTIVDLNDSLTNIPASFAPGRIGGQSDIIFTLNSFAGGVANPGELRINGTKFYHPDGTLRTLSDGLALTAMEGTGTAGVFGSLYLMWTDTPYTTRWPYMHYDATYRINTNFVFLRYNNGWKVVDNSNIEFDITIAATDCIVAVVARYEGDTGISAIVPLMSGIKGDQGNAGTPYWVSENWIDLSDTATYDPDTWYPVVGTALPNDGAKRIKVSVQLNSGTKPAWSTHGNGFSVDLDVQTLRSGWDTTYATTTILLDTFAWCPVSPVSFTQLIYGSLPVLFCRGGGKYKVITDYECGWTPYSSDYVWTSGSYTQTAAVSTTRPVPSGTAIIGEEYSIIPTTTVIKRNKALVPTPNNCTFNFYVKKGSSAITSFSGYWKTFYRTQGSTTYNALSSGSGTTCSISGLGASSSEEYVCELYADAGFTKLLERESIPVLFEGSQTIKIDLTNDNASLPSDAAGVVSNFTGSASEIHVYEGVDELTYDGTGTANGTWKATVVVSDCTGAALTDSGVFATLGAVTAMSADKASRVITVTGKTAAGVAFTRSIEQTLTKNKGAENQIIYSLLPEHVSVKKTVTGVATPSTTKCKRVLHIGNQREVIGEDTPIAYTGRNLIKGSKSGAKWGSWTSVTNGEFGRSNSAATEIFGFSPYVSQPIYSAKTLVLSFDIKKTRNVSSVEVFLLPDNYVTIGAFIGTVSIAASDVWQHYTRAFVTPAGWSVGAVPRIRFDNNGSTDGLAATITVKNVKLEYDVETPWSAAPEDSFITMNGSSYTAGTDIATADKTSIEYALYQYTSSGVELLETKNVSIISDGAPGAQGESGLGLGVKINKSAFNTANNGSLYFHGFDSAGNAADVPGYIYDSGGTRYPVDNICYPPDTDGVFYFLIPKTGTGNRLVICAFYDIYENGWYQASTNGIDGIDSDYLVIGEVKCKNAVIVYGTLYSVPKTLEEVENAQPKRYLGIAQNCTSGSDYVTLVERKDAPYITVKASEKDTINEVTPGVYLNDSIINHTYGRGHTLVVINPTTGAVHSVSTYDSWATPSLLDAPLAAAMNTGYIVCLTTFDACGLTATSRGYLQQMGSKETITWEGGLVTSRRSHAFIGSIGFGSAYEAMGTGTAGDVSITASYTAAGLVKKSISAAKIFTLVGSAEAKPGDYVFCRGGTAANGVGDIIKGIRIFTGYYWVGTPQDEAGDYRSGCGYDLAAVCSVYEAAGVSIPADVDAYFDVLCASELFVTKVVANEAFITKLAAKVIELQNGGVIKSQNFLSGVRGFQIGYNGDAEFNQGFFNGALIAKGLNISLEAGEIPFYQNICCLTDWGAPYAVSNNKIKIFAAGTVRIKLTIENTVGSLQNAGQSIYVYSQSGQVITSFALDAAAAGDEYEADIEVFSGMTIRLGTNIYHGRAVGVSTYNVIYVHVEICSTHQNNILGALSIIETDSAVITSWE